MPEAGQPSAGQAAYWNEDERLRRMRAVLRVSPDDRGTLLACVAPMMIALDWFGAPRSLASLVPPEGGTLSRQDLLDFLVDQGFRTGVLTDAPGSVSDLADLPVGSLLETKGGRYAVYIGQAPDGPAYIHDGTDLTALEDFGELASVTTVQSLPDGAQQRATGQSWIGEILLRNPAEPLAIFGISAFVNLLALAVSLFTMTVYNTVIPSGSIDTLWALLIGAVVAILGGWALRLGRLWAMARYGSWLGYRFGNAALGRTLSLPYEVSDRLGINQTLNRFRSIEGVRQFLSSAGGTAFVDGPFTVIFIFVIALIGGWIALVPVLGLLTLAALAVPMARLVETASGRAGRASTDFMEMTTRIVVDLRSIKATGETGNWMNRYAGLAGAVASANRDYAFRSSLMQTVGHAVSMVTVLSTMAVGIFLVLGGGMNTGGLIAAMMLVWRIVGPAERAFTSVLRVRQIRSSARQLDRLMASPVEAGNPQLLSPIEPMAPRLVADRLVLRYSNAQEPALNGVGLVAESGEVVAVVGPNGAGKTSLLECLAGLRTPQAGTISISGRNIKQFDPSDYRSWLGFATHNPSLFPLSARSLLLLKHPECGDAQLEDALREAGGEEWRELLPDGLATHLDPFDKSAVNERRLRLVGLACALVAHPPLLLLDDPVEATDGVLDSQYRSLLKERRPGRVIVFSTHRPDLIKLADKILILDKGNVVHFGPVTSDETDTSGD